MHALVGGASVSVLGRLLVRIQGMRGPSTASGKAPLSDDVRFRGRVRKRKEENFEVPPGQRLGKERKEGMDLRAWWFKNAGRREVSEGCPRRHRSAPTRWKVNWQGRFSFLVGGDSRNGEGLRD